VELTLSLSYLYRHAVSQITKVEKKSVPKRIKRTLELINTQLYSVEERIRQQAREFDPAVEGYVAYACESNGKRLRPALALLAGGATGNICSSHLDLAVVLELIHAASLVHDDIMDGADKRRGQPTVNAKWGNTISVLLGDCLFAHALKLSTTFPNSEISKRIASAASDVCSGEIVQTQRRFDLKLSIPDYFRIIEMKTAALFGAATELGAFINESPPEVISAMKTFGLKLGIAYQIYDDCLDIAGDESNAGKTLGSDLRKGKLTLPLLNLLQSATPGQRRHLSDAIVRGEQEDIDMLIAALHETGALRAAIAAAKKFLATAAEQLDLLPENKYRNGLRDLCESVCQMLDNFAA
jgi:octaprenyl-diphosphate synthase